MDLGVGSGVGGSVGRWVGASVGSPPVWLGRPRRPRGGRAPGRDVGRRVRGGGRGGARGPGGVLAGRRLHGADRAWVVGPRAAGRRGQHRRVVVGPARVGAPRGIEHLTPRLPRRPDDAEGDPDGEQADDQGARDRQAAPSPPGPDRGGHREARRIADRAAAARLEGGGEARRAAGDDGRRCAGEAAREVRLAGVGIGARDARRRSGGGGGLGAASWDPLSAACVAARRGSQRSRPGHVAPCGARARSGTVVQAARRRSSR